VRLPAHKTKIVCTIGPASQSRDVMEKLLLAGMNVARLNFSHGDFSGHKEVIVNLRAAARATGHRLAIMADLPGPKMRATFSRSRQTTSLVMRTGSPSPSPAFPRW
jgi:pyruvate kinase